MMMGWALPGEDGDHLGEPQHCQESPMGVVLGFWLEKTPWPQQQGFGSNPKLLVRTARGWEAGERAPTGF